MSRLIVAVAANPRVISRGTETALSDAGRRAEVLRAEVLRDEDFRAEDLRDEDLREADLRREEDLRVADLPAVDFRDDFREVDFRADDFPDFFGTFSPPRRASDKPMAIACLRLFTFLPLRPLRKLPLARFFIADSTFFDAPREYFRTIGALPLVDGFILGRSTLIDRCVGIVVLPRPAIARMALVRTGSTEPLSALACRARGPGDSPRRSQPSMSRTSGITLRP